MLHSTYMLHSTDYYYILLMLVEAVTASSTHHQSFLQLHRIQSKGSTLLTIHESSSAQLILLLHIRKLILLLQIRHNFQVTRQCGVQSIRYISATSASRFRHIIVLQPGMYSRLELVQGTFQGLLRTVSRVCKIRTKVCPFPLIFMTYFILKYSVSAEYSGFMYCVVWITHIQIIV